MSKYKSALPKLPARGYFKKGDKGPEVVKLQKGLNWANNGAIFAPLKTDGVAGDLTIRAVKFFQMLHNKTVDAHFGKVCRDKLRTMDLNGRIKACNWALSVALDNTFTYGSGQRAHRSGCYFCGTNTGPKKSNKERKGEPHKVKDSHGNYHTYTKTYCCNPFITAAYAHGAKDPVILKICKSGSSCGMEAKDWLRSKNFKKLGSCKKVAYSDLKWGDVILTPSHVWMYIGGGRIIEASGNNWSSDSISMHGGAKSRYSSNKKNGTVLRYTA